MNIERSLSCPICNGMSFEVRREATYIYSYKLNTHDMKGLTDNEEGLPFLFDNREKSDSNEYILCLACNAKFPCSLNEVHDEVKLTILQKAIRADNITNPDFLG